MKRQKETIGSILEIDLKNGNYAYAQILKNGFVFFDFLSKESLNEFSILENCKILFIIVVYKDIVTRGHWLKVGKLPIKKEFEVLPMKFVQDGIHKDRFELYDPNTGETISTNKDACKGLERSSIWDAHHVEDRIRDYYNGVPCKWLKDDLALFT